MNLVYMASPDIVLEGMLQFSIMLLLKIYCPQKYFHIKTLNNRITPLCYGPIESANKPSTFKEMAFLLLATLG